MLKNLWLDEGGAVLTLELILLVVLVALGVAAGMACVAEGVNVLGQTVGTVLATTAITGLVAVNDGADATPALTGDFSITGATLTVSDGP